MSCSVFLYAHLIAELFGTGTTENDILTTIGEMQNVGTLAKIDDLFDVIQIYYESLMGAKKLVLSRRFSNSARV